MSTRFVSSAAAAAWVLVASAGLAADLPPEVKAVHDVKSELAKAEAAVKAAKMLVLEKLELDQSGILKDAGERGDTGYRCYVESVLDKTTAVIRGVNAFQLGGSSGQIGGYGAGSSLGVGGRRPTPPVTAATFVVKGVDTKRWIDDKQVSLSGMFKVVSTKKVGGRTLFILERTDRGADADPAAKVRAAAEKLRAAEWSREKVARTAFEGAVANAEVAAKTDNPIPKNGTFQERAAATAAQDRAIAMAIADARKNIAAMYELNAEAAERLLKK
jgi:hypothetical protein